MDSLLIVRVSLVLVSQLSIGEHFGAALGPTLHRPDAVMIVQMQLIGLLAGELLRTVSALNVLH